MYKCIFSKTVLLWQKQAGNKWDSLSNCGSAITLWKGNVVAVQGLSEGKTSGVLLGCFPDHICFSLGCTLDWIWNLVREACQERFCNFDLRNSHIHVIPILYRRVSRKIIRKLSRKIIRTIFFDRQGNLCKMDVWYCRGLLLKSRMK